MVQASNVHSPTGLIFVLRKLCQQIMHVVAHLNSDLHLLDQAFFLPFVVLDQKQSFTRCLILQLRLGLCFWIL